MGCNSSAPASEPGKQGGVARSGKGHTSKVTFTYFDGLGRGDPLTQLFEYAGQPYQKRTVGQPEWEGLKAQGKGGEFGGGLPQVDVTIGGKAHNMAQFGATLRSFGIRYGLYDPKDWKLARYCDPVVDTWADVLGAMSGLLFAQTEEQKAAAATKYTEVAGKMHGLIEKNLTHHGGRFAAGNKCTIADVCMASYVGNYIDNPNSAMSALGKAAPMGPKFTAYCQTIRNEFPYLKTRPTPGPF